MARENHLSYKVTKEGADKIERLRRAFIELDDLIDEVTAPATDLSPVDPASVRAKALAKTNLEDARMWAVQAVVRSNNTGPADHQGSVCGAEKSAA